MKATWEKSKEASKSNEVLDFGVVVHTWMVGTKNWMEKLSLNVVCAAEY